MPNKVEMEGISVSIQHFRNKGYTGGWRRHWFSMSAVSEAERDWFWTGLHSRFFVASLLRMTPDRVAQTAGIAVCGPV